MWGGGGVLLVNEASSLFVFFYILYCTYAELMYLCLIQWPQDTQGGPVEEGFGYLASFFWRNTTQSSLNHRQVETFLPERSFPPPVM
jgi:hypothetical protein